MKMRDHDHGVTLIAENGLEIHLTLVASTIPGHQYLSVSTNYKRVDMRISPKGHVIKHWLVESPMTPNVLSARKEKNRDRE